MVFYKGTLAAVNRIMKSLAHFNKPTSFIANMEKSNIFQKGVTDDVKDQILTRTRFTQDFFLIKYLGLPLFPRICSKMDYYTLMDKITHRIKITNS